MITLSKPAVPLALLSVLALIGIIVLAVLKIDVPEVLTVIAYGGLTASAAATVPNHTHDTTLVAPDGTTAAVTTSPVALVPTAVPAAPVFPVPPGA